MMTRLPLEKIKDLPDYTQMGVYEDYLDVLPGREGVSRVGYIIEGCGREGDYDALSPSEKETAIDEAIGECRSRMAETLATDQYYCEYCGEVATYHDDQQSTCGRCCRIIGDNHIVEVDACHKNTFRHTNVSAKTLNAPPMADRL